MKIITEHYCNLAKSQEFQKFLRSIAPDLYKKLIRQLQQGESCKDNRLKMIEIQSDLDSRNLLRDLKVFLSNRFPHTIANDNEEQYKQKNEVRKLTANTANELYDRMNYHKVFPMYNPRILMIPQRHIIIGPEKDYVRNQINRFICNKLDVDYLILKGQEDLWHGYIEYFSTKYSSHIKNVDHSARPIAIYRKKIGITR